MIESTNFTKLKEDIQNGPPLVLFVGSGVSGEFIPTWQLLLRNLIDRAVELGLGSKDMEERNRIKRILAGQSGKPQWSSYEKAGIIKRLLGSHYIRELHDCLYRGVGTKHGTNKKTLNVALDETLLGSVGSLCLHKTIIAIITYNFDDLLETVVRGKGGNVHSVYGREQHHWGTTGLPVYHVHGFLPREGPLISEEEALVIFSEGEYFQAMLEPFSWQTTTQLHFLRNYTCLLLGTSVTDLDMLRILSHARSYLRHGSGKTYVLTCRRSVVGENKDFQSQEERDLALRMWAMLMDDVGVRMILAEESYRSVRDYINELDGFIEHIEQ